MLKYHTVSKNMIFGKQKDDIWLIAGLGNPGLEYEKTRHNAGFMAADKIAEKHGAAFNKHKFKAVYGEFYLGEKKVFLMKPQTYMNNSGEAVREAMQFYKLTPAQVLVMMDDISLPVGKIRIRRKGSDGGQKGMRSIITLTGSDEFPRIKLGVGAKPHPDYDLAAWVLSKFTKEEQPLMVEAAKRAADAACLIAEGDIDAAMNQFSR